MMKTKIKNCYLCSTDRKVKKDILCLDCNKIKNHIRDYGIVSIMQFINNFKTMPSAPPY